jgi:hypothetical protein
MDAIEFEIRIRALERDVADLKRQVLQLQSAPGGYMATPLTVAIGFPLPTQSQSVEHF